LENLVAAGPGQFIADRHCGAIGNLNGQETTRMEAFLFWIFAIVGVSCGIMVVWNRNPMNSAIYLVVTMLCLAGFYVLLHGGFIATIQVLVYAGAVVVLILFVIMMLNLREGALQREGSLLGWGILTLIGLFLVIKIGNALSPQTSAALSSAPDTFGTLQDVGANLFGRYVLPFELTSILLLVAIIGAVVLARRTSS
jgi:NADH-quinone oxidoreductase subunit J